MRLLQALSTVGPASHIHRYQVEFLAAETPFTRAVEDKGNGSKFVAGDWGPEGIYDREFVTTLGAWLGCATKRSIEEIGSSGAGRTATTRRAQFRKGVGIA